ncbi:MAG: MtrB/PioB family decaheme-associated outer membrane protein [Elusimicrobia bacterium]|nr:MtrB/PioB family decaheme-associated outer membrane protein [Elusimicrobiota bacterium]
MKMLAWIVFLLASKSLASEPILSVDFWGQAVRGNTASSKFDEYIDVPHGFYLERLGLDKSGATCYFQLDGFKPGLKDQRISIETGMWGLHKLSLSYDQIPHNLSNTAQTFLRNDGNGTFTLPDNMQSSLQTSTNNAAGFLPWSPVVALRVDRKKAGVSYTYNPTGQWRTNLDYEAEKKEGNKAIGVTYGHGQIQEVPEPVDYQTHHLKFETEYVGKDLGWSAGYQFSSFENGIKALTLDNPFQLADVVYVSSGIPGSARLTLPPSNQTHQLSAALNAKTTARSRLNASLSLNFQSQNDPFLPFTSNQSILDRMSQLGLPGLPQQSLDGKVYTLNGVLRWNWKPKDRISVNVHANRYSVDNRTPSILFDQYVQYDTNFSSSTPTTGFNPTRSRRSLPLEYKKTGVGADFYYSFTKPVSMKLAYDWERVGREFRESESTQENIYTASLNVKPFQSLVLRPSYQYSFRTVKNYNAEHVAEEAYPLGEGTSLGQLEASRKYDQAGRKRHKVSVRGEWDPLDFMSAGLDYGLVKDDFEAEYGALDTKTHYYSVDVNVNPSERWGLYSDYTWEQMTIDTKSRYRETAAFDFADNDWIGRLQDTVHTFNMGANYAVVEDKLDADVEWGTSYAKGIQRSANPNPLVGSASQKASATATDLPNTYTRFNKIRTALRYRWLKNLVARLSYEYQRYTETDWSQDRLDVYQSLWNKSVFLGATQPGYHAHLVSLGLSYTF